MSRTMRLFPLIAAVLLLPVAVRADDGDAALMKACPGLADWAATHPHRSDEAAQEDLGRHVTDPVLR